MKADTLAGSDDQTEDAIEPVSRDTASDPVDAICAACDGMSRDAIAAALRAAWAKMK